MSHLAGLGGYVDTPGLYVITIDGFLDPDWSDRVHSLQITHATGEGGPQTVLTGWLVDQGALHGVLATLNGLALPIVSLERIRTANDTPKP